MSYNNKVATYGLELGEKMRKKPENFCKFAIAGSEKAAAQMVVSLAGRDCGGYFLVVGVEDENHLWLADGRARPIECPKKKKLRHVKVLDYISDELNDKLIRGETVLNAELRKAIAFYKTECRKTRS